MSFFGKLVGWMSEHKFLTAGLAAGTGYLVFSKAANAAPALPGAGPNAKVLPSGGIVTPKNAVPPPNAVKTGSLYYVTTQDPAPDGNLNARATGDTSGTNADGSPIPSGTLIGYFPKDGKIELLDVGSGNGMVFVQGPGICSTGDACNLQAWVSSRYIQTRDQLP